MQKTADTSKSGGGSSVDSDAPVGKAESADSEDKSSSDDIIAVSAPAEVSEIDLYEKREKIYTRKIEGFFQRIRLYTGWPLLLGYFILPWIPWGDRPAVLFDLPARQFHIFWLTIWPQDLSILGLILIISAFALFAVTALAGRVWCGYTCPQTVWTAVFMWIEQKVEGTRNQRMRLDKKPWSFQKFSKKVTKHLGWLGFAALTGLTFIGYFTPIYGIVGDIVSFDLGFTTASWIVFFTLSTYFNAGWAREQLCKYVCPYARFQSSMFDKNTLIISYDKKRGEPRGSRKRGEPEQSDSRGSCVDCKLCVQVCPTGIDIRNGLQYECISCALCIDACDSIMDKMGYQKGLIRYTTEYALENNEKISFDSVFKRFKVLGYITALSLFGALLIWRLVSIEPIELSVLADRQALSTAVGEGLAVNRYTVKVVNKSDITQQARLSLVTDYPLVMRGPTSIVLQASEVISFPVLVELPSGKPFSERAPVFSIRFELQVEGEVYSAESRYVRGSR